MNNQKLPKKFVFRPSEPQSCPHLYREIDGKKTDIPITWLPGYSGHESGTNFHMSHEEVVYQCSLSGYTDCNNCLSDIEHLSKLGLKLKSDKQKTV